MKSEPDIPRYVLAALGLFTGLEAAAAAVWLGRIPSDPKNAVALGLSVERLILLAVLVAGGAAAVALAVLALRKNRLVMGGLESAGRSKAGRRAALVSLLAIGASALASFSFDAFQTGRYSILVDRLEPLLGWMLAASLQACLFLALLPGGFRLRLYEGWLIAIVMVMGSVLLAARLPQLVHLARVVDLQYGQMVTQGGDDIEYVVPAINVINGYGYIESMVLPPQEYHAAAMPYLTPAAPGEYTISYRPAGAVLFLAGIYEVFGSETINARMGLILTAWITGLVLLALGAVMGGWPGAVAGGLSGLFYLYHSQAVDYTLGIGAINSEIPAVFWFACFSLLFMLFLRQRGWTVLILSALSLAGFILTRGNYLPGLILVCGWLFATLGKAGWRKALAFTALAVMPMVAWSAYINIFKSITGYRYISQGEMAFAITNNVDVLEGVGPEHYKRGDWPPSDEYYYQLGLEPEFRPGPGENGYLKGLQFWWDYREDLPRFFFQKLRFGTWYHNGEARYPFGRGMNALFLGGIGLLLLAAGLRTPRTTPQLLARLSSRRMLMYQCVLVLVLFIVNNWLAFWVVLLLWLAMGLIALLRPYGDAFDLPVPAPTWLLAFIASYLIGTMLYASDRLRYHAPLDPVLMVAALTGTLLTLGWLAQAGYRRLTQK